MCEKAARLLEIWVISLLVIIEDKRNHNINIKTKSEISVLGRWPVNYQGTNKKQNKIKSLTQMLWKGSVVLPGSYMRQFPP